jgi:hypothetical protein
MIQGPEKSRVSGRSRGAYCGAGDLRRQMPSLTDSLPAWAKELIKQGWHVSEIDHPMPERDTNCHNTPESNTIEAQDESILPTPQRQTQGTTTPTYRAMQNEQMPTSSVEAVLRLRWMHLRDY